MVGICGCGVICKMTGNTLFRYVGIVPVMTLIAIVDGVSEGQWKGRRMNIGSGLPSRIGCMTVCTGISKTCRLMAGVCG